MADMEKQNKGDPHLLDSCTTRAPSSGT